MKIGIGVTTHNRHDVFIHTIFRLRRFLPENAKVVIVDDASNPSIENAYTYRFETNVGIAKAKNKCLELLDDCDHIFLFDDDTYPLEPDWWKPYVESPEPHLMYQFNLPGKPITDMRVLYKDDKIVSYSNTRGAMIYLTKQVLETVGGFDEDYGLAFFEHPDYTNRIHNAGLTTHRAMDVPNSHELLYCLDQDIQVASSIPGHVVASHMKKNFSLYSKNRNSKEYKAYK